MYFSRITLKLERIPYVMQQKIHSMKQYAIHQWLWQLFPNEEKRPFLFRELQSGRNQQYYLLSEVAPLTQHELFLIESKPYSPQLTEGMELTFSLRANPVICKQGKRYDVMMNAKHLAKKQGLSKAEVKINQDQAAIDWLVKQGKQRGFSLLQDVNGQISCQVMDYFQHQFIKKKELKPINYSSVDFEGILKVTEPNLFLETIYHGIGKSRGFGCGLFLIKRLQ
ncbi:type I-E CRISPR-associated protein Cas6/Cse3/CasE [Gilliamella sp. wkB108]|uniref:type I-E CRISPR-associated protein Cas6/Cse3/CasE n=1 Tax=Gilliamella sp. wkB108 TaxID=3120256 RepID=UPI00080E3F1C|nr:type I-E CRISPR-associated protein Cas6/Cse3/CasE [Gilliamella apicola]OCG26614.1 type I-E CRISPR-associated protein Cas6/Cse3/CasE [Gilliamella apicola]